ncbi:hypothetical protein, partial [Providencia rettgeri]|uniref:hypothetical protein n=1 Tax=Providencia rettgeri TaxID=587 RepID=UPI001C832643
MDKRDNNGRLNLFFLLKNFEQYHGFLLLISGLFMMKMRQLVFLRRFTSCYFKPRIAAKLI